MSSVRTRDPALLENNMTAAIAVGLMVALLLKHFICDFLLQTGGIAMKKHNYRNLESYAHSAFHVLGVMMVLGCFGLASYWFLAFLTGVIHYSIDWAKGNLNDKLELTPTDTHFWWLLGADQLLHGLTYCAMVGVIAL